MEKETRNTLRGVITQCRKLLEEAIREVLEGKFGIHLDNKGKLTIEDATQMYHLSEEDQQSREQMVVHIEHIENAGFKPKDAFEQFVREVAFTHLNRICAYKMMETRDLIREAVSRGVKSQGFLFYLADHPDDEALWSSGQADLAYRDFLVWLGKSFSQEIPVLFYEHDPANYLFPPHRTLQDVLDMINSEVLQDIWSSDETLGWVYQYFTPKELREQARKESQAPRNSYELAFRNQFYTPRYVVEFLTDNTLGRIWYEMRAGGTILVDKCKYLVRQPNNDYRRDAEDAKVEASETSHSPRLCGENLPEREIKDPRDIKILDPACGSGHFLLYCFDLLMEIYSEAYVRHTFESASHIEYMKQVPAIILRENLHGIDIDRRATQIAALALWLRAQRAYQEMGISHDERPKITKANIVCAEPMPGNEELLYEFMATLHPPLLGQLVERTFEKMKLAGEAGSLLKIEEEISQDIAEAKRQWLQGPRAEQMSLFPDQERPKAEQLSFDLSGITDDEFWDQVEERVFRALNSYAQEVSNSKGLARRLFADDAVQGFDFVDMCRKQFDVVLMNPPFGAPSNQSKTYITKSYPRTKNDVYAAFIECLLSRMVTGGMLGAITSRTGFFLSLLQKWREEIILKEAQPTVFADLGSGVLDTAMVETAAYCLLRHSKISKSIFFRLVSFDIKDSKLIEAIKDLKDGLRNKFIYSVKPDSFQKLPRSPFAYWVSEHIYKLFTELPSFEDENRTVKQGLATADDFRFVRSWWEVSPKRIVTGTKETTPEEFRQQTFIRDKQWVPFAKGGEYSPYYADLHLVVNWGRDGEEMKAWADPLYNNSGWSRIIKSVDFYFRPGLTYPRRLHKLAVMPLPKGSIISVRGSGIYGPQEHLATIAGLFSSSPFDFLVKMMLGRFGHPQFDNGTLCVTPIPHGVFEKSNGLASNALKCIEIQRTLDTANENSHTFYLPALLQIPNDTLSNCCLVWNERVTKAEKQLGKKQKQIDDIAFHLYGIESEERKAIEGSINYQTSEDNEENNQQIKSETVADEKSLVFDFISYTFGCVLGRWDIRIALNPELAPQLQDPFDPMPVCSPGMLVGTEGLPATKGNIVSEEWLRTCPNAITLPPEGSVHQPTISEEEYPLNIDWDGILVDDLNHPDDIVRRVRDVLEVLFGKDGKDVRRTSESALHVTPDQIEQEACEILGVKDLRDYFRKPGNGGFWMDHVKRYSKSRRKAPIYWLLQSTKKNYALWLYYHRLDKDILLKALVNYVEPKLRLEQDKLEHLRAERQAAGTGGSKVKRLERQLDKQEAFLSELRDFEDKLRKVANLHLDFGLNDGVVLNIAPLWELVPWKEAKKYWDGLLKGKYEWSSMAKQLREKGIVK